MKKRLSIFLLLLIPAFPFAQSLSDSNSFAKALKLAIERQKPLMLIIAMPAKYMKDKSPNLAIQEADVVKKIKENFVVFETDREDTAMTAIITTYKIKNYPTFLFMHGNKDLFHSDFGFSSAKFKYLNMLEKAIDLSKEKSVTELQSDYLANKKDNVLLKKLIELRRKNGLTDNAVLIEQYANNLNISDFSNYQTVLFILQAGPYADGNAYKFAFSNKNIIDTIYKKEPFQTRSDFNNAIINNTMNNAKKTKNVAQAQSAAIFLRGTWSNDYQMGLKNYNSQMMGYYLAVKDTANYMRNAVSYYDHYYMNLSADSIKKIEIKQREAAFQASKPTPKISTPPFNIEKVDSLIKAGGVVRRETVSVVTGVRVSVTYANQLNTGAWNIYDTGTKNINYLTKAMIWSRRSLELSVDNPPYLDTHAHILYRLGYREQALTTEENAIKSAKIKGMPYDDMQEELKKMKSKLL